jgi:hypothetical protein
MVLGPAIWCTQALPWSASATEMCRLLLGTGTNTASAKQRTLNPLSQLSVQKRGWTPRSLFPVPQIRDRCGPEDRCYQSFLVVW